MRIRKNHLKSSLAITTSVGCRNACSYCPQKSFVTSYKKLSDVTRMSFDTFTRCLESVPKEICLSFSGFSEPWLNPDCTKMILYAHNRGFMLRVNTTLIGMKQEDILQLSKIPFIKFVVHLPDNQNLTKIRVDETYLRNLSLLIENQPLNLNWKFHKTTSEIGIHADVQEVLQKKNIRITIAGLNNRAGKVDTGIQYSIPNKGKVLKQCQDFHHNILLPNGDVVLCHMDWSLRHILGNLLEQDYSGIHSGKIYTQLQASLLNPDADILCRDCEKDIVQRSFAQNIIHTLKKKLSGEKDPY